MKDSSSSSLLSLRFSWADFINAIIIAICLLILAALVKKCTEPCCSAELCAPESQPFRKGQYILEYDKGTPDLVKDSIRGVIENLFANHDEVHSIVSQGTDTCMCDIPIEKIYLDINSEGIDDVVVASTDESFEGEGDLLADIVDSLDVLGLISLEKVWVFRLESAPDAQNPEKDLTEDIRNTSTSDSNIVAAIIDNGIQVNLFQHYLGQQVIWKNNDEESGDDGNCIEGDLVGWNFASNNDNIFNANLHGSFVAEVVKQRYNLIDTKGRVKLMTLRIDDEKGNCDVFAAACAIHYAARMGADVVNASWGLYVECDILKNAVERLGDIKSNFVSSLGNNRLDLSYESIVHIPSDYSFNHVLGIGGLDEHGVNIWGRTPCECKNEEDVLHKGSNYYGYGCNLMDIAVYDDFLFEGISLGSSEPYNIEGTSYAAPGVSGLVAGSLANGTAASVFFKDNLCSDGSSLPIEDLLLKTRRCSHIHARNISGL